MKKVILAYIPVLHQGYLNLFKKHPDAKELWLLGSDFISDYRQLVKDVRALDPEQIKVSIEALKLFDTVKILTKAQLSTFQSAKVELIVPEDTVNEDIVQKYFKDLRIAWDTIFLRWDRKRSESYSEVQPDVKISREKFDQEMMKKAKEIGDKSTDWWRQVGSILMKDGKIIAEGRNIHLPQDFQQYTDGDPRAEYGSGERFELSSSLHSESHVIALAAKKGIPLDGAILYTWTFPCPNCAKLITQAGIKKLYYLDGYSLLDGENVLKAKGVEIIKVEMKGTHGRER